MGIGAKSIGSMGEILAFFQTSGKGAGQERLEMEYGLADLAKRSLRKRASYCLTSTYIGRLWEYLQFYVTFVSIVLYVRSTYNVPDSAVTDIVEWFCYALFFADYLLRWFASSNRVAYIFTFMSIVDLITLLPVVIDVASSFEFVGFNPTSLRFIRVLRVLRVARLLRRGLLRGLNSVHRNVVKLIIVMVCIFFVTASLLMLAEADFFEYQMGANRGSYEKGSWQAASYGNMLYLLLVTMSSVGYGDMVVFSYAGRAIISIFIVCIIIFIPIQLSNFSKLFNAQRRHRISYKPERKKKEAGQHVLIVGEIGRQSLSTIAELLHEFYNEDRTFSLSGNGDPDTESVPGALREDTTVTDNDLKIESSVHSGGSSLWGSPTHVRASSAVKAVKSAPKTDPSRYVSLESVAIIMGQHEPSEELRELLLTPQYSDKVRFALRSPYDAADLEAVSAVGAAAIFIVSNEATDSDPAIALLLIILRSSAPNVPVYVCAQSPLSLKYAFTLEGGVVPIVTNEMLPSLIAMNARIVGAGTLVTNLLRCALLPTSVLAGQSIELDPWEAEYAMGSKIRVQSVRASSFIDGFAFTDVARSMYALSAGACVVIGVAELPVARDTPEGQLRLARLRRALDSGTLLSSEAMRANIVLSPMADAMCTPVPGEMLFNPGTVYGIQTNQLLYVLTREDGATSFLNSEKVVEASNYQLGLGLSAQGRDNPHGFPETKGGGEKSASQSPIPVTPIGERTPVGKVSLRANTIVSPTKASPARVQTSAGLMAGDETSAHGGEMGSSRRHTSFHPSTPIAGKAGKVSWPSARIVLNRTAEFAAVAAALRVKQALSVEEARADRHTFASKIRGIALESRKPNFGSLQKGGIEHSLNGSAWQPWQPPNVFLPDLGYGRIHEIKSAVSSLITPDVRSSRSPLSHHIIISCVIDDIPLAVRPLRQRSALRYGGFSNDTKAVTKGRIADRIRHSIEARTGDYVAPDEFPDEPDIVLFVNMTQSGQIPPHLIAWLLAVGGIYIVEGRVNLTIDALRAGVETAASFVLFSRESCVSDGNAAEGSDIAFAYRSLRHSLRDVKLATDFTIVVNIPRIADIGPLEFNTTRRVGKLTPETTHSHKIFSAAALTPDSSRRAAMRAFPAPSVSNLSNATVAPSPGRHVNVSVTHPDAGLDEKVQLQAAAAALLLKKHRVVPGPFTWSYFSPLYVSGQVVPAATIHCMITTAFFDAAAMTVVSNLLVPWQHFNCEVDEYVARKAYDASAVNSDNESTRAANKFSGFKVPDIVLPTEGRRYSSSGARSTSGGRHSSSQPSSNDSQAPTAAHKTVQGGQSKVGSIVGRDEPRPRVGSASSRPDAEAQRPRVGSASLLRSDAELQHESTRDSARNSHRDDEMRTGASSLRLTLASRTMLEARMQQWGGAMLFIEPVPSMYHRQAFGRLYSDVLNSRGTVVIGLLRSKYAIVGLSGGVGTPAPADYVFTCPDPDTRLWAPLPREHVSFDRMYFLAR